MKKAQNKSVKGKLSNELIYCLRGRIILVKLCIYKYMKANNKNESWRSTSAKRET